MPKAYWIVRVSVRNQQRYPADACDEGDQGENHGQAKVIRDPERKAERPGGERRSCGSRARSFSQQSAGRGRGSDDQDRSPNGPQDHEWHNQRQHSSEAKGSNQGPAPPSLPGHNWIRQFLDG